MPKLRNLSATLIALAAVLAISGCQANDRAGGNADIEATDLRFAVTSDIPPQVSAWADEVDLLSKGSLKITFVRDTRAGEVEYEAGTIADVRAGTVDIAWVGSRVFDTLGVTAFQPLLAPTLIDSLELQGKVFEAGIPQAMLPGVEKLDVAGVGILPGPIRKVLGVNKPFTAPADFAGQTVGIQSSEIAEQTLRTLGGIAKSVPAGVKLDGLDAYEQQLASIQGNHYADHAKYVTGNLNLWPRPLVIIANQATYQRLTDDQRAIMANAAKHAIPIAMDTERKADTDAITALCRAGMTFAQSSKADLVAFREALSPVYTALRKESVKASVLDQITRVKDSLHRAPDTADCSNVATDQDTTTRYDGTYTRTVNWSMVEPCPDGALPGIGVRVDELILRNGSIQLWNWEEGNDDQREIGWDGTYSFFNDQMLIEDSSARLTVDFAFDGKALTLSNLRGGTCGDSRAWTTRNWIRR